MAEDQLMIEGVAAQLHDRTGSQLMWYSLSDKYKERFRDEAREVIDRADVRLAYLQQDVNAQLKRIQDDESQPPGERDD